MELRDATGFVLLNPSQGLSTAKELSSIIDHTGIGVADVARSSAFYDAVLGTLGLRRAKQLPEATGTDGVGYGVHYPVFWIDRFHPHGVKQHTAFVAKSRAEVEAFHTAALKAGGTDNGLPGIRPTSKGYPPGYYAAFVLDPDGNNVEAVFREAVIRKS
jgi:catechol 2,3-dioxygenase-like lactoylglutathione lyase family enzyme